MRKQFDSYFYGGIFENPNITDDIINEFLYHKPNKIIMEAIAGSEKSSSQHLEYIYNKIKNFEVQLNLASNKKTPHNILKKLFEDFTEEVYENPNIPPDLISYFLSQNTPKTKKERGDYDNNCKALARNPVLSKEEQLEIAKKMNYNPKVQEFLYLNPALHFETFEYLWSKGITNFAGHFLSSSNFESTCIDMLLGSDDDFIRSAAIRSNYCPDNVIESARNDDSTYIRTAAYSNPKLPINFDSIDYSDNATVLGLVHRKDVAENILIKIANNQYPEDSDIKFSLALESDSVEVLQILLEQGIFVPSNPNLTTDMIEKIIKTGNDMDRLIVLRHPKINHEKIIDLLEINKVNQEIIAKPYFILPDWYQKLVATTDKIIIDDDSFSHLSFPKVFIPSFKDSIISHDEVIGVIGGYFFQSEIGDKNIDKGWAPPVLQLNLKILSKKTGINFGESILQVWGSSDDWGQGQEVYCDEVIQDAVVDRNDNNCVKVKLPKNILDADQYEKATECFDWSESFYSRHFGLNAPYFITDLNYAGINTQLFTTEEESILEEILNKSDIDTKGIEAFAKENSYFESHTLVSALQYIQKYKLSTSVGNFDNENYIKLLEKYVDGFDLDEFDLDNGDDELDGPNNWKRHGRLAWKPLITIEGPSGWGVEDYYSVYYRQNEINNFEYKAMARRYCY